MCPPRDQKHGYRAHQGGNDNRPKLFGNNVEIEHKRHTGRHKEETEVAQQEIGNAFHPLQFNPTHLQEGREQQHAHNTARQTQSGEPDNQFPQGHTAKKEGTLFYHFIVVCIGVLRPTLALPRAEFLKSWAKLQKK